MALQRGLIVAFRTFAMISIGDYTSETNFRCLNQVPWLHSVTVHFVPHLGHGPSVTRPRAIKNKSN